MRLNKRAIHEAVAAYLFLLPSFVGLVVFVVLPIIKSFLLSFHNWDLLGAMKWNGLKNYRQLIKDPFFIDSLKNTAYFSFVSVPCNICIGLFLAVMLNQKIRGVKTYRVVYFGSSDIPVGP